MAAKHYVIIGNGVAGNAAAAVIRERDAGGRITIVSLGALLFYDRYRLPEVIEGQTDWRRFLVHPPAYYEDSRIVVRRRCRVAQVDPARHLLTLGHREEMTYDALLVASGGRGHLPMALSEFAPLLERFDSYRQAMAVAAALGADGGVVMLGGDIQGIAVARKLAAAGHRVTLVPSDHLFWPHRVAFEAYPRYLAALGQMGIEVVEGGAVERIEATGEVGRRVVMEDGRTYDGKVVMPYYGLAPALDFMAGSGVDTERGLLVNPELRTTDESIWAAGDVCQIWSAEENAYRFYYGWTNVKAMGETAAGNMTGGGETFHTFLDERLAVTEAGALHSSFWDYER